MRIFGDPFGRRLGSLAFGAGGAAPAVAPTITSSAPATPVYGVAYSHTYTATGTAPITWSVVSGALPDGLSLSSGGVLSGTPTLAGTYTFTVQASNAGGTATQAATLILSYIPQVLATQAANLVAYWPGNEPSGTNADDKQTATNADGLYTGTFTLNQTGIGDGNPAVLFDGSTARISLTAALAALNGVGKFNGAEGTAAIWCKIPTAGVWTDGTSDCAFSFGADTNNRVFVQKSSVSNEILASYRAGAVVETIQYSFSSANWFHVALTWSKTAEQFRLYINGLQAGATAITLGIFAGALASTFTAIGEFRSSAPSIPWNGLLAHCALWNTPLTAEQVAMLALTH